MHAEGNLDGRQAVEEDGHFVAEPDVLRALTYVEAKDGLALPTCVVTTQP